MVFELIIAAALLITAIVFFLRTRKVDKRPEELAGTVACKKCGSQINVANPSKVHDEFSVACNACKSRKLYSRADLKR
jgi:P pilus assembly chaperone PapD